MAIARQQYQADWSYVDKQEKEFTLTQEIIEKLDSIEPWAERNFIQWIKVNWETQEPDQYRVVDISVPIVEDVLNSTDRTAALSARQGRVLYNYIRNLQSLWKFLSNWNSTTGMPTTNPSELPYEYKAWDYYIISVIGATNYRPEGSAFSWWASSTVETEEIKIGDIYMYDWTDWLLLLNTERQIAIDTSLSISSTNPVENRVITNALNTKQDIIIAWNNIQIAADGKTISATDTTYTAWNNINIGANNEISAVDTTYTAGTNVQIDSNNVISATDTVYWAWTNIQISAWNIISATDTTYSAWTNIQIDANNVISATDTTYVASDFDIKDLADSTDLRNTWSWKQDSIADLSDIRAWAALWATALQSWDNVSELVNDSWYVTDAYHDNTKQDTLIAWNNIQIAADGKTISATDTTYTAWTWIDITNWVISNTQTSAVWWNIQWTLSSQTDLQTALDAKQDTISDLNTIRNWANAWATAIQPNDNVSSLVNDAWYLTNADITQVNDATLTITQNWTSKWTFTANQLRDATIDLTDTTYTASDFDIKDLSDSTQLRATWSGKQDAIADLSTIRSWAALWATALQSGDNVSELVNDAWYITSASLPTVNNWTLTIQKNWTNVATFTANQSGNSTANLIIPTTASDVDALPDTTKYWANLSLSLNTTTYVITAQLKDQDWNNLWTAQTVDLPLESVVVSGSYDSTTKKVILTLKDWSTIDFSVADLISWLQSEITSTNKLSADLVDDTSTTHKFVSSSEKSTWNAKQDAISDLAAIRSWASAWATAVQPEDLADVAISWLSSDLTNDAWFITASALPTVWNATITIQKNGTVVDSFTANATDNKSINITLAKWDVWLWNVDNTSDANKPVSTAQASAIATAVAALAETVDEELEAKLNVAIEVTVETAYNTAAKVWTTTSGNYSPVKWDLLLVKIVNGCCVASPSLNIDWSWAKNIRTWSANANTNTFALWSTSDSNIYALMYYDGTYYRTFSTSNNTYSDMSVAEWQTWTATTARSVRADYLKQIIQYHSPNDVFLTQAQYDALTSIDSNCTYFIYE